MGIGLRLCWAKIGWAVALRGPLRKERTSGPTGLQGKRWARLAGWLGPKRFFPFLAKAILTQTTINQTPKGDPTQGTQTLIEMREELGFCF